MGALPNPYFTSKEYLALEVCAEYKSQYVAGEIFAMAGAEPWHVKVTTNLTAALVSRLRGRPCEVYNSDMRVRVAAGDMYTYPDLSALCGEPRFEAGDHPQSLLNPQVIVEVLSPSTKAFDRGEKFARYRRLDSLVEYVLVASEWMHVHIHRRAPNGVWSAQEHDRPESRLRLESLDCEVPLAEIYERVAFPERR